MTPIEGMGEEADAAAGAARHTRTTREEAAPEGADGRALVAVRQGPRGERARGARILVAGFLAQLIATDQQLPQTCARRRAEPQVAAAAYDTVMSAAPARTGRRICCCL